MESVTAVHDPSFIPLLHSLSGPLVFFVAQMILDRALCRVAHSASTHITHIVLSTKIIGADTEGMAKELFLPLPRAHGAILCTSTTFPFTMYFSPGVVSIIRIGFTSISGGHGIRHVCCKSKNVSNGSGSDTN